MAPLAETTRCDTSSDRNEVSNSRKRAAKKRGREPATDNQPTRELTSRMGNEPPFSRTSHSKATIQSLLPPHRLGQAHGYGINVGYSDHIIHLDVDGSDRPFQMDTCGKTTQGGYMGFVYLNMDLTFCRTERSIIKGWISERVAKRKKKKSTTLTSFNSETSPLACPPNLSTSA